MVEGDFELREVDWTPARLGVAGLMLVVSTVHFALTTTTEQLRFAVLALGLLVCFVVYFTDLWRPRYYLAGAGYVCLMGLVWFVSGMPMTMVGYVDTVLKVVLVALFVYLAFGERRDIDRENPTG